MPVERTQLSALAGKVPDRDDWEHHWDTYARSSEHPGPDFRRRLIVELLGDVVPASHVLDIGSGTGELAGALQGAFPDVDVLGLELSRSGVEQARMNVPRARFVQRDLLVTADPPEEYRAWATHAVCSEVLEHVDDPTTLLLNSRPYMAPRCRLVVTVPGGPMTSFDRHIGHRRHYRAADLVQVVSDAGFEVLRATGFGFPVFNLYRLLVLALGDRAIDMAGARRQSRPSRAAMRAFEQLLRLNSRPSTRGWQIVAIAHSP